MTYVGKVYAPGPSQKAILRASIGGTWFLAIRPCSIRSCLKLHDNGFLDRDPKNARRYQASAKGAAWLKEFDANFGRRNV
ncbi:hypothetical protein C8D77_111130 [Mesorhizobium loti]|uniref:Uncharacterized protein n=1 Tax=Rhizobium loti TaxID=381 RepID=A0A8E3B3F3_RHILI|nr:hypothetical protein [Mesorhizobium loti]PWJ88407.1 hypothetical protein C8D77_111130 [Mesorhizobium loti]